MHAYIYIFKRENDEVIRRRDNLFRSLLVSEASIYIDKQPRRKKKKRALYTAAIRQS